MGNEQSTNVGDKKVNNLTPGECLVVQKLDKFTKTCKEIAEFEKKYPDFNKDKELKQKWFTLHHKVNHQQKNLLTVWEVNPLQNKDIELFLFKKYSALEKAVLVGMY